MKVDDLLRIYFSLGALAPDTMPASLKEALKPAQRIAPPPAKIALPQEVAN
jgi:hypothetical protein